MCPRPDKVTFNIVLGCYAKSSQYGSSRKAVKLLKEMEELDQKPGWRTRPDAITHLLVIQALGRERTIAAAEMALDLLHKLQNQYMETRDEVVKPNKIHFNAVINAFSNTSSRLNGHGAAKRAEDVLQEMHDLYYKHNQYSLKPDRVSYSSAITGYANEGRPLDAERILGMMIEEYRNGDTRCKPDTIAYTSVINSWAQSGEPGAAQRATEFLRQMEEEAEHDPDLRPTKVTYGCVINAYANEGSGEMAAAILRRMEQLCEAGDKEVCPDKIAYNMVLKGFAEQRDVNAPQRAEALYRRMEQLREEGRRSMRPDVLTVNALLKCWVTNDTVIPSKRILGLLGNMLSTSEKRQRPNDETFDLALRVLLISGDDEAVKRVEAAWKKLRGARGAASVKPYRSSKRRTPPVDEASEDGKDDEEKDDEVK
jgi:pentatricopeptide repeat protein